MIKNKNKRIKIDRKLVASHDFTPGVNQIQNSYAPVMSQVNINEFVNDNVMPNST